MVAESEIGNLVPRWKKAGMGVLVPWWHKVYLGALCRNGKAVGGITISAKRIQDYFPEGYTKEEIEEVVYSLLDSWRAKGSG